MPYEVPGSAKVIPVKPSGKNGGSGGPVREAAVAGSQSRQLHSANARVGVNPRLWVMVFGLCFWWFWPFLVGWLVGMAELNERRHIVTEEAPAESGLQETSPLGSRSKP